MLLLLPSFRYMSQAKHAEARELMYNGALLFFSYNQVNACFRMFLCLRWGLVGGVVTIGHFLNSVIETLFFVLNLLHWGA